MQNSVVFKRPSLKEIYANSLDSQTQSPAPFYASTSDYSLGTINTWYNVESQEQNIIPYIGPAKDSDFASYVDLIYLNVVAIPKSRQI